MASESLFEANFAIFEQHFPALRARLKAITKPLSSLVFDGGEAIDINLGSGRLYRGDGRRIAAEQAEAFAASPARVGYLLPDPRNFDSMLLKRMHGDLLASIARHEVGAMSAIPDDHTGYLFILGVGLGYHLPAILEHSNAPHVVICEAFEEFLLASMRVVDWGALVASCEARGAKLHLICASTPEEIVGQANDIVDRWGAVLLDGSYFHQHYALWALTDAKRRLINELPRQMATRGYFEDERKMVRNTAANLQKYETRILKGSFRYRSDVPVFIIGAGPSLDESIPYIKKWRDHAIVFSAGSGLQPCLKNGIIPDFHVEIENTYYIYSKLKFIFDQNADLFNNGKFGNIRLITSSTVNPLVPPLFSEVILFFRDSAASSLSFGKEFGCYSGVAPTVANTSLGVVAHLGLGDVYLFGADCGWRDEFSHHSRDTIYYTSDAFRNAQMKGAYTLPGNFGGTVQSDLIFDWCRDILEQAISAYQVTVFNCSDGALIRGATPRVAESLEFDGDPLDRDAVVAQIMADRPRFAPGEFFRSRPLTPFQAELDRYETAVQALTEEAIAGYWPFRQFHDSFWRDFGGDAAESGMGLAAWVQYASISLLKHASVFLNRIADGGKRQAVTRDFYVLFKQAHAEMFAETRAHLEQIAAWVEGGSEPEWADGKPRVQGTTY